MNKSLAIKDDQVEPFLHMNMEESALKDIHLRVYVETHHQNSVKPEKFTPPCLISINGVYEVQEVRADPSVLNEEDGYFVVDDEHCVQSAGANASSWELSKTRAIANLFAAHHLKHNKVYSFDEPKGMINFI